MYEKQTRRDFLKQTTAVCSTTLAGSLIFASARPANAYFAAIVGIATVVWNIYSSSQKVSVPDPTKTLLLELFDVTKSIHTRLTGIEDSLAKVLRRLDNLKVFISEANEDSAARTAAIDLNAECAAFSEFALNSATKRTELRQYLQKVAAARNRLEPRSDIHALSLCSSAYTEISGHELICSDEAAMTKAAQKYLDDFESMQDETVEGSLANLKKKAKERRDQLWFSFCARKLYAPRDEVPAEFSIGYSGALSRFFREGARPFYAWFFLEKTRAQYDHDISRQVGWCAYTMFRRVPDFASEAWFQPRGYTAAKLSKVFRRSSDCSKQEIWVTHALHDLIAKGSYEIEVGDNEFPIVELNRVPFLSEFSFETVTTYNASWAYINGTAPTADDYFLKYGEDPIGLDFPLPQWSPNVQRAGNNAERFEEDPDYVFYGGDIGDNQFVDANGQTIIKDDHIARFKATMKSKRDSINSRVKQINEAQQAYISLAYMLFCVEQTQAYVENFVENYKPDDPCHITD